MKFSLACEGWRKLTSLFRATTGAKQVLSTYFYGHTTCTLCLAQFWNVHPVSQFGSSQGQSDAHKVSQINVLPLLCLSETTNKFASFGDDKKSNKLVLKNKRRMKHSATIKKISASPSSTSACLRAPRKKRAKHRQICAEQEAPSTLAANS